MALARTASTYPMLRERMACRSSRSPYTSSPVTKRTCKDLDQAVGQRQRREVLEVGFEFGLETAVDGHAVAV